MWASFLQDSLAEMTRTARWQLPWLEVGDPFPPIASALPPESGYGGLLAAGADLSPARLISAYRQGIFPWFSDGEPILWWSTDPRMVLFLDEFKISRSFRKTLRARARDPSWSFWMNRDFTSVIKQCSAVTRHGQAGTWITDDIQAAYIALHHRGVAHSFEAYHAGQLVGGGYGIAIGRMFYGESMFALATDASKLALAGLVNALRALDFHMLDCQQKTPHLASLGARAIPRTQFAAALANLCVQPPVEVWPQRLMLPDDGNAAHA